eukprot:TRINITY_DN67088_c6_g1_i1.p1 TRINITY_DN67088_c6_g1~~TRINITY_DN67088_c6_g1_i1.p1  ORF type:complete len:115 (-),score=0.47 TRINITY_DN67088_c6_g1_i1:206-550(-)
MEEMELSTHRTVIQPMFTGLPIPPVLWRIVAWCVLLLATSWFFAFACPEIMAMLPYGGAVGITIARAMIKPWQFCCSLAVLIRLVPLLAPLATVVWIICFVALAPACVLYHMLP